MFHQRKVNDEVYHLHLTYTGNKGFTKDIAFRDYLRSHPTDAQKYAEVKKLASQKANQAKDKKEAKEVYMSIKKDVINEILENI